MTLASTGQMPAAPALPRVLVTGIYMVDVPSCIESVAGEMARAPGYDVDQRWIALGRRDMPPALRAITKDRCADPTPKFALLNRLLSRLDPGGYDYVIVCDDDIELPAGFLPAYLGLIARYDFALAQPARTHDSYTDHPFVEQLAGITARCTRFVEIGPLFSMTRDAARLLVPFDERSPMGWGYDFAWPCILGNAGHRMGIVDGTPVRHVLRKPVAHYAYDVAHSAMQSYLAEQPHLSPAEAFFIVSSYV